MKKTDSERTVLRKAKIVITNFFLLFLGFIQAAHASTTEGHAAHVAPEISSLAWPLVNFLIYLFILNLLYRKLGKPALLARTVGFEQAYQKADSYLEEMTKEHLLLQDRLKNIREEKEEIRRRIDKETEFEINSIFHAAEYSAKQIALDVQRKISQETAKINAEVKNIVVLQAMKKAEEKLKKTLSPEQDYSLRQNTIRSL